MQTNNLKINLVAQAQAQKEVTINEAIARLEALQNRGVEDKDLAAPPALVDEGEAYIVAGSATGAWLGEEGNIAYYIQGWKFIEPNEGLRLWVKDEQKLYIYDGMSWVHYLDEINNIELLGVATAADSTNKLAVASEAVLFSHGVSGDMRLKFNKSSAANTATLLFQNAYSGRAEIGLAGDDDFRFKVSADGSSWNTAVYINQTSGAVDLSGGTSVGGGATMLKILSATASLDFPSISINTSADLTITVTGATTGSVVSLGLTTAPTAGIVYMGFVSAANTVTIRAFNITGAAINPASQTFRVMVTVF